MRPPVWSRVPTTTLRCSGRPAIAPEWRITPATFRARPAGSPPWTLLDYFPEDFLLFVDESHMSIPQIHGMYGGDRSRKQTLVDFGFRLPSALDNRPLSFSEFGERVRQSIYVSATPGPFEQRVSQQVVEQLVRPTGLLEPTVEIKPTKGQVDDLIDQIKGRVAKGERCLVTTLTKRMAEELADYLSEAGIKTHYLHSEVVTLERVEILRDLRLGVYDVVVGSISCVRDWTCRKSAWWQFSMRTRKVTSGQRVP